MTTAFSSGAPMPSLLRRIGLSLVFAVAACSKTELLQPSPNQAKILLAPKTVQLTVGDSLQLFVFVLSATGDVNDTAQVGYSSTDSTVVTVNAQGMIHARAGGQASIIVTSG